MGYVGQQASIPFGQLGLHTDDPMTSLPPNAAIKAFNVSLTKSKLEKSLGSAKYNTNAFSAAVVGVRDWWPSPTVQRMIAVTADGKIYRDTGSGGFNSNTAITSGLGTLDSDVHFVSGGLEVASNAKKLFIFTIQTQIRVLSGDGTSTSNISNPASDWSSSNYPTYGVIFQNRLAVIAGHTLYFSRTDDHENFTGTTTQSPLFAVFPGEGDGLVSMAVYKGRLFLFKQPYGVYYLETQDSTTPTDWSVKKLTDMFGIGSPHAHAQVLDDLLVGNRHGGITSLQATQAFGDLKAGDILTQAQVEEYIRTQTVVEGAAAMHAVYYNERKRALFTTRSSPGADQDRMIYVDVARQNPRITLESKDQPTCLAMRKDNLAGVERPFYGAEDGFIYLMERATYDVGGEPYLGEFQTPYIDFSYLEPSLGAKSKIFDFLQLHYVGTGDWPLSVDVFIDNSFVETISFTQSGQGTLDSFVLDTDVLSAEYVQRIRKRLHGTGQRISFRIWNNGLGESFRIEKIIVEFRLSAEQNAPMSGAYSL